MPLFGKKNEDNKKKDNDNMETTNESSSEGSKVQSSSEEDSTYSGSITPTEEGTSEVGSTASSLNLNDSIPEGNAKRLWSERSSSGTDDTVVPRNPKESRNISAARATPITRLWSERDTSSSSDEDLKRSKTQVNDSDK